MSQYRVVISDDDIIKSCNRIRKDTDFPNERDLLEIREGLGIGNSAMISLHWLRNRLVALRRNNLLFS